MNERENFRIQTGEPTNNQLLEINKCLEKLRKKNVKPINIGIAFIPSTFENTRFLPAFKIGVQQCSLAKRFLKNPNRELVFAFTDSKKSNGYALPCGKFDAVLMTIGFLNELNSLIIHIIINFFNESPDETIEKISFKREFFSFFSTKDDKVVSNVHELLFHLSMSHLIGHELGHLASGHFGFSSDPKRGKNKNHSLSSDWKNLNSDNLFSQAKEIDADAYAAEWTENLLGKFPPPESNNGGVWKIVEWVQQDPCRKSFIFCLSSLLWYATFNMGRFSKKDFLKSTTHPPLSFRARLIMDSALYQRVQKNHLNMRRHEQFSGEALFLLAYSATTMHMSYLANQLDRESQEMLARMKKMSKRHIINKSLGLLGLFHQNERRFLEIKGYLEKMNSILGEKRKALDDFARWRPECRVRWRTQFED